MPSYYLTATESSVTFHITAEEGYVYYRLFFRRTDSTDMILSGKAYFAGVPVTFTHVVNGLEPSTSYTANVYYSTNTTSPENFVMGAQTIVTKAASGRPSDWVWTTNIAQGLSVPQYEGILAPITAQEWNAFTTKINEFRKYQKLAEYTFTTATQGGTITAAIIGEATQAIGGLSGHGAILTASNAILASFWINLAEALNAVP